MSALVQSFPRMLKMLRENSNIKEKREALTYIRSNCKKLESTKAIKEEQYKDLCKLIIDTFASGNNDIQNEAYETLNVILRNFQEHNLHVFEAISQISRRNRLKILKLLDVVEEHIVPTFAYDSNTENFFKNSLCTVQTSTMPWIAATACTDNLQALKDAESKPPTEDQKLDEETINCCMNLLRKLYKVAARVSDNRIERFHGVLMDKIMLLAYMGHKRQRGHALRVLQQALATNITSYVRAKLPSIWSQYVTTLQSTYCKRMLLLVSSCELDWTAQWNISIQYLGVDLHCGAGLINNLLSVEEKAFKSTDTIIRRQAFLSWKLLVDNFALDSQELATARRVKLLCIPLNAKNSKTELIALTKLEVWWHVIVKLYKDIHKFVNPVLTHFLNFCFGPLGDEPFMSTKFDMPASPGKRFVKTKVVAIDALCQLLVTKEENHSAFSQILEERLHHSITNEVFQLCYKSIIHSVGEALLVLSQLTDEEMKNKYQFGKKLWTSLMSYIQASRMESKETMYKEVISVIAELANCAGNKPTIKDLMLDIILLEITHLCEDFNFQHETLSQLFYKLLHPSILNGAEKKHYNALSNLLWSSVKSEKHNLYYVHAFNCIKETYEKLQMLKNPTDRNESVLSELWIILADNLGKYMDELQEINEGTSSLHNFKTVESIITFPFVNLHLNDPKQVQELTKTWKHLYKQFEARSVYLSTVKPNEILLSIASIMQRCLTQNDRSPYLIISCLDVMLCSLDYNMLIGDPEVPSIMNLIVDLLTCFFSNKNVDECRAALKSCSAFIITIYGLEHRKAMSYLEVSKPAIELMIESEMEPLYGDVANIWECVICILKEITKSIDCSLLKSYKKVIMKALNHANDSVRRQTASIFKLSEEAEGNTKSLLEEIIKETENISVIVLENVTEKAAESKKQKNKSKPTSNFLKIFNSSKSVPEKDTQKTDKKLSIDTDTSQEYVPIQTDIKFDVNRMTEHQKESLKRRRDDIPAMYNDLSQSCSQDTENLQEWFDRKSKNLQDTGNEDGSAKTEILDDDANKENKIEVQTTISRLISEGDTKMTQNMAQTSSLESMEQDNETKENLIDDVQMGVSEMRNEEAEKSKDTSLNDGEDQTVDRGLSPSMLINKGRNRTSITPKPSVSSTPEDTVNGQSSETQTPRQLLRRTVIKSTPYLVNAAKRGTKRKSTSDSESEATKHRQRRRTAPTEMMGTTSRSSSAERDISSMGLSDLIEEDRLNQRTKNEISRLRINMLFDSPLSNFRCLRSSLCKNSKAESKRKSPKWKQQSLSTKGRKSKVRNESVQKKGVNLQTEESEKAEESSDVDLEPNDETQSEENLEKEQEADPASIHYQSDSDNVREHDSEDMEKVNNHESNTPVAEEILPTVSQEVQIEDDMDDIVESSQQPFSWLQKCTVNLSCEKIHKVEKDSTVSKKVDEIVPEEDSTKVSSDNDDKNEEPITSNEVKILEDTSANTLNVSTPVLEGNSQDNEKVVTESPKTNGSSSLRQTFEYSSPKGHIKRPMKFGSYPGQGRAAHMLGLVTKQGRMENEGQTINVEEEFYCKRTKPKDSDLDSPPSTTKKDQGSLLKEIDKTSGSCGSRQEKIFNNMRLSDYCSSPPTIKLFSNLKNDGEKMFPKTDKSLDCIPLETDSQMEKVGEETLLEMAELPMLEWSSANPPSLTASPSASILKRQRNPIPEPDSDAVTPNKRKRVSFADPPVSKEMGYEATSVDSPHKSNKFASRGPLLRKDSPYRLKQIRQKSVDQERDEKEDTDLSIISEGDLECERENELLTVMAEELEYPKNSTLDTDVQLSSKEVESERAENERSKEKENTENRVYVDNLSIEFEITEFSVFNRPSSSNKSKKIEENDRKKAADVSIDGTEFDDSETQEDIFVGANEKQDGIFKAPKSNCHDLTSEGQNVSIVNTTLDLPRLNVTNDSIIEHSSDKQMDSDNLEDTVDAGNLTGLNSSASSDEIFCGKFVRTSTQAAENLQEQDTLPVTESMFGSLPLSQDSQSTNELSVEMPDQLDSENPIYPPLITCKESINSIMEHLTNPLWTQYLSTFFHNRNIETIGDLARLSERDINRIPVKGNSKIEYVRGVLKHFEKANCARKDATEDDFDKDVSRSVITNRPSSSVIRRSQDGGADGTMIKSRSDMIPLSRLTFVESLPNTTDTSVKPMEFTVIEYSHIIAEDSPNGNPEDLAEDPSTKNPFIPAIATGSKSSNETPKDSEEEGSVVKGIGRSLDVGETLKVHSTRTVGTCTSSDFVYSSITGGNKVTKSVETQMPLDDLLDEVDPSLLLENAARRCKPEKILMQYKHQLRHLSSVELEIETLKLLGTDLRQNWNDATLKSICRSCGINRVLLRLPDIFGGDRQFFVKVLNAYKKKFDARDCLDILDTNELKKALCEKYSSTELVQILSEKLKDEEQKGIIQPVTELSSLNSMLKRMPMDQIISHTVANEELIPSQVVLDIALQNNTSNDIATALQTQSSVVTRNVFDQIWSAQLASGHIKECEVDKEDLLTVFKAIGSKLSEQDLLDAFYESMNEKVKMKSERG